jgi:hypothetical protein
MRLELYQNSRPPDNVEAIGALVRAGLEKFPTVFPDEHQDFGWHIWLANHLRPRSTVRGNCRLYFSRLGSKTEPLPNSGRNLLDFRVR